MRVLAAYRQVAGATEKCCPKCKEWKPWTLDYFSARKRHADGRVEIGSWCRPCVRVCVALIKARDPGSRQRYAAKESERKRRVRKENSERRTAMQAQAQQAIKEVHAQVQRKRLGNQRAAVLVLDILTRGWGV